MSGDPRRVGVIGAGAWGTALATVVARAGGSVVLWDRDPELVAGINQSRVNRVYLPDIPLDPAITATTDGAAACAADLLLLTVPAQYLRAVLTRLAPPPVPLVICAKGIEVAGLTLMSDLVAETVPGAPVAVLSGPTFAVEVARGLPAACTLACAERDLGERLMAAIGAPTFRPYYSDDVRGAQVGGAVKNVIAIAAGIVTGRDLGLNARAALITRGLAETMRLGTALGGRPETLMGLSGLGDLTLTCTGALSRNFTLGEALGRGETLADIQNRRRSVAEGVATARAVVDLAARHGVEMPIARAVADILHHGADIDRTVAGLLARRWKAE